MHYHARCIFCYYLFSYSLTISVTVAGVIIKFESRMNFSAVALPRKLRNLPRFPDLRSACFSDRNSAKCFIVETIVTDETHWFIPASICSSKEIHPLRQLIRLTVCLLTRCTPFRDNDFPLSNIECQIIFEETNDNRCESYAK